MRGARAALGLVGAVVLVLGMAACGSDGDDDVESGTTTTAGAVTTTTAPGTGTSGPAPTGRRRATAVPDATATPQNYGDACALGSLPDCIDPDGDGQGTYLQGGADCVRRFADSPELCNDLDGDGTAGYPDSG